MKSKIVVFVLAVLALGGCVTSGTYDQKVAELSVCQDERLAMQAKAKTELDATIAAQQELEAGLQSMKTEYEGCRKATEEARQYSDKLKQREADLRDLLQKELTDKQVEISQHTGQLTISVLDRILFRPGRADILPAGQAVLEKVALVLVQADDMIRVEGHTDNVPISEKLKDKYLSNWELSAARAASVVRYFQLGERKIDPLHLEAVGLAEFRPVVPNDSDANKQRNRRVEIVLTAMKPPAETAPASPDAAAPPLQ